MSEDDGDDSDTAVSPEKKSVVSGKAGGNGAGDKTTKSQLIFQKQGRKDIPGPTENWRKEGECVRQAGKQHVHLGVCTVLALPCSSIMYRVCFYHT